VEQSLSALAGVGFMGYRFDMNLYTAMKANFVQMQVTLAIPSSVVLALCAPGLDRLVERSSHNENIRGLVRSMRSFDWRGALYLVSY
jgi:hypothetical protein